MESGPTEGFPGPGELEDAPEGIPEGVHVYTPAEAERILSRSPETKLSERRIRQMLQAEALEGGKDERGRWYVLQSEVHRLRDERRTPPQSPPGASESASEMLDVVRALERERGRLEARLELTERAESTMQAERKRLLEDLERERERAERERERADRLAAELAERPRGFFSRFFGRT